MKLVFFTIVHNGMPWITHHYPELRRLAIPWQWIIVEGAAAPEHCTSWCSQQPPSLSTDGTSEYLDSIYFDTRITLLRSELWHGKLSMVNAAMEAIFEPCLLVEIDADELWTSSQLTALHHLFTKHPRAHLAYFYCRYFVGPNLYLSTRNGFGNHTDYEWLRAWRYAPGMRFKSHEPPVLEGATQHPLLHADTERAGLVFDHMAWATEPQVAFKCRFYGSRANKRGALYSSALDGWHKLQHDALNPKLQWPQLASTYLPFIEDTSQISKL